ncbi:uncharacterized protein LOC130530504 isoform X2 [Takifugu flavidus]|uniref:uncharacterized protein LOC130530504 isoform X2 n=1 Tax=Takifugu flavidus TaxID=433684 RepID=UPI0025448F02|nr:uncharacterized protein LOC130530504 isoform X2 [Takifugu flavidus]
MKLLFPLFLLNVQFLQGQERMKTYQPIVLMLTFHSFYNSYNKSCCKLYYGGCDFLLDSTGFTSDSLKGRVTIAKDNGWIEFKISHVRSEDAGYYRCMVVGFQHFYFDYYVELSEVSDDYIQSQPSVTPTLKHGTSSATLPQSTAAVMDGDLGHDNRASWSLGLPISITVTMAVILITSIIGVIFCRFKAKRLDKCEISHESSKQDDVETSGVVYTTVDFTTVEQAKVRKNPRMQETQAEGRYQNCRSEPDELVEYSVLTYHQ